MEYDSAFVLAGADDFLPLAVTGAKAIIQESKLDYMRCILSGAPYARVTDEELTATLLSFCEGKFLGEEAVDSLLDSWDLTLLTMCNRVSPNLVNRKEFNLVQFARAGTNGYARLISFYLTRFLFSFKSYKSSEAMLDRLHFSIAWYDFLALPENADAVATLAHRLATVDSWLNLSLWKELPLFGIRSRTNGIRSAQFRPLREMTQFPFELPVNLLSLESLTTLLTDMLVASEVNLMGPAAIAPNNPESINVASEMIALFGKTNDTINEEKRAKVQTLSEVLAEIEDTKRHRQMATRQATSATYGKAYKPNEPLRVKPPKVEKPKKTRTPREAKPLTEKQKKKAAMDARFAAAFNTSI